MGADTLGSLFGGGQFDLSGLIPDQRSSPGADTSVGADRMPMPGAQADGGIVASQMADPYTAPVGPGSALADTTSYDQGSSAYGVSDTGATQSAPPLPPVATAPTLGNDALSAMLLRMMQGAS